MKMPLTSLFGLLVLLVAESRSVSGMTAAEISEVVDHHNALRVAEGADNMELMVWNNVLAAMATTWAARCAFEHGQPQGTGLPTSVGQNLYLMTGALNLTSATQSWYDEKADYDYDTLQCAAGRACGHYTQVVWASSRELGCGYQLCPTVTGSTLANVFNLVCNYGPAGNYVGQKPYTKGLACSKCGSGAGWCTSNGLCNGNCTSPGTDCSCAAVCYNCATLNSSTCRCSCADGWQGSDCKAVCNDTHKFCGSNPGWPRSWCDHPVFASVIRERCPATCRLCTADESAVSGQCPPVRAASATSGTTTTTTTTTTSTAATAAAAATTNYPSPSCDCKCP